MKKLWLKAILIAVVVFAGLIVSAACLNRVAPILGSEEPEVIGGFEIQSAVPRIPYFAYLEIADLEASTWYILVDLSDEENFPHVGTTVINLKQLNYTGVLSEATHWDMHFGVVGELGDSTTYVEWFHVAHRVRNTQFDEKWTLPEHGLNLALDSSDELRFVATTEFTNTAAVTTTTALESPVTESGVVTTTAGDGDLILYVEEIESGGYFEHLSLGVAYDTE